MLRLSGLALILALTAPAAVADVLVGDVVATRAAWSADDRAIVTTATVRTAAGDVEVEQLGGHADGYTMVVFDGEPALAVGMRAEITARAIATTTAPRYVADRVVDRDARGRAPFVRTTTNKSGKPLRWAKGCVEVAYGVEGTTAIPGDGERAVIEATLATWNQGVAGCSYQHLVSLGPVEREVSGRDFVSVVKFRDTEWCRPAVDGKPRKCHSNRAAGITTAVFVDDPGDARDGELVDADIELNGVDFALAVDGQSLGAADCQADLANTLTHELGHLLGLEHTCLTAADAPHVDGAGQPVPLCTGTLTPAIVDATMYPFQDCGETSKATLSPDELTAVCTIYPTAEDPGVCAAPDPLATGCCSTGAPTGPSLALGVAVAALLRRRRSALRR
ncbi:MAG: hypothetical protein IPL61_04175 [Myxococcales bacterium]|nr:hypothetical protein [Myxococcales bacterium]